VRIPVSACLALATVAAVAACGTVAAPAGGPHAHPAGLLAHRADPSDLCPAETIGRLRRVKAAHDPDDLIRSNHPIKPQP
jgi:hypothetical protein